MAVVGPLNRKGTGRPRPRPGIISRTMEVIRRLADQVKPACWICSAAYLENCMVESNRLKPEGFKRLLSTMQPLETRGLLGFNLLEQVADADRALAGGRVQHTHHLALSPGVEILQPHADCQ